MRVAIHTATVKAALSAMMVGVMERKPQGLQVSNRITELGPASFNWIIGIEVVSGNVSKRS
jgi:hypothetical protein